MQQDIKGTNVQLSSKSRVVIRDILNDAWNLSFLSEKLKRLSDARSFLQRQEVNLAKNMGQLENARTAEYEQRVTGWITETKDKISRVKEDIMVLENEITELRKIGSLP